MAATPGVLYIGGFHVQGGNPGLNATADGLLQSTLRSLLDRDVLRITPDHATTGAPTAGSLSCWPWYDGNAGSTTYVVASSTTTTATVSPSPGWTVNAFAGRVMTVCNTAPINGVGFAQRITITSNTADTVTFGATTAPTVGATFFIGIGRFNDYHPIAGWLDLSEVGNPSTRGGSSYQTSGLGVGPDATLVRRLLEDVYDEAPYFHLWKFGTSNTVNTGWADSPNDAARAGFLAELVRVDAAATARGNTIDWAYAIIDLSMADLVAAGSNPLLILTYEDRLREMIAWLRSAAVTDNPDLGIVLVNHRSDMWSTTAAGGAPFFRAMHVSIAADTDHVAIVDMEGARIGVQVGVADTPATEVKYYAQAEYFRMGDLISEAIERLRLGTPATPSGGFPVYLSFGDSIFVGEATAAWVLASNSTAISGPTVGSLLRPSNQKVWNRQTGVLETFLPGTNSNTSGSVSAFSGPLLSIMAELSELHPGGFAVVHRASYSSALATEALAYDGSIGGRWIKAADEHYTELQADYAACVQYVNEVLGKQVDLKGMFVSLGHNDQTVAGGGAAFAAALQAFCNDLWADFPTRTSGRKAPIIWRRPQDDAAGVNASRMAELRAGLAAMAALENQFRATDVDGLERDRDDNLHEAPRTSVTTGERMVADLLRVAI